MSKLSTERLEDKEGLTLADTTKLESIAPHEGVITNRQGCFQVFKLL